MRLRVRLLNAMAAVQKGALGTPFENSGNQTIRLMPEHCKGTLLLVRRCMVIWPCFVLSSYWVVYQPVGSFCDTDCVRQHVLGIDVPGCMPACMRNRVRGDSDDMEAM